MTEAVFSEDRSGLHVTVRHHALVTRGGWTGDGTWLPLPNVSASAAGWVR